MFGLIIYKTRLLWDSCSEPHNYHGLSCSAAAGMTSMKLNTKVFQVFGEMIEDWIVNVVVRTEDGSQLKDIYDMHKY